MKLLILTSSTGGGHNMRAQALKAWTATPEGRKLGFEVTIHQALEATHPLYGFGVEVYNWIQRHQPRLHHVYFNLLDGMNLHRNQKSLLGKDRLREVLESIRPQVIVSTHGHLNHAFFDFAREVLGPNKVRCVTYCGELSGGYGFSKHWVNPAADLFLGAVDDTLLAAARLGMPAEKNILGGFLLRPNFFDPPPSSRVLRRYVSEKLQLDPDRFILVLGTGANGANNHLSFLKALLRQGVYPQVVALCGANETARQRIEAWGRENLEIPVRALPRIEVDALFRSASALLARPGTGTTSEAIVCGCPIIFNGLGGIMPQELITVRFAERKGFKRVVNRPSELPPIVRRLMEQPREGDTLRASLRSANPSGHPLKILNRLAALGAETAEPV